MNAWKQIMPAALLGLLTGATGFGAATNRYVALTSTNPLYPYTNWATAATSISDAVTAANANNAGDTVYVSNGVYYLANQIMVTNTIVQNFSTSRAETVISGNNYPGKPVTNRCFYLNHANAIVDGFTITNGSSTNGGGVYLANGTFRNCTIAGNTAIQAGGGVYITSTGTLTNCIVNWNICSNSAASALYGGGGVCIYQRVGAAARNCVINSNNVNTNYGGGVMIYGNGTVRDCSIQGNYVGQYGGGIAFNTAGALAASNCVIRGNSAATHGGGVYMNGGATGGGRVSDCTVDANSAANSGGGAYIVSIEGGNFERTTVSSNTAIYGGGIYLYNNNNTIEFGGDCFIAGNSASGSGGGLYLSRTRNGMSNCLVTGNSAGTNGGGVFCAQSGGEFPSSRLMNFLIANNVAGNQGGGVYANQIGRNGGMIMSSTVVSNYANRGGGIALNSSNNPVINTVIYSNAAAVVANADLYDVAGNNATSLSYCCTSSTNGYTGPGNLAVDPKFSDALNGNWRLGAYSPCINAGINQAWMDSATDLDGRPRLRYNRVDIGAYEQIYSGALFIFR